jgi:CubicO group peptidase (beta-lactamase class C family)
MNSIDALVQAYIDKHDVLGVAVAIIQDGKIVHLGGYGVTSVEENRVKITPQTLFAFGSISKTICATLVIRLVEKGLLDLDTPVVNYLPGLKFSDPDHGQIITIRHLLSHTSGLPMAGKYWGPRDQESLKRFVYEQIPHYRFIADPGSVHLYSNTVFCIAGHVAEAVIGMHYEDLVQAYVFEPLQMDRTTFDPAVALTYPVALPHKTGADDELRVIHRLAYNASGNPSSFALGSVSDLANLALMFINRGKFAGQQFLAPSSVAEMHRMHVSRHIEGHAHPLAHVNQGYGLGFSIGSYKDRRSARHGGMSQSYNCFFDLFPDDRTGVVLLTNYSQEESLMELVVALYDHALAIPHQGIIFIGKPAPISQLTGAEQLQRYSGAYLNVEAADLATFVLIDDELVLERQGQSMPLVQFGEGKFFAEVSEKYRLPVTFLGDSQGKATHVSIAGEPYFPFKLDPAFEPNLDVWKAYEGVYQDPSNANLEETFTVRLTDGMLFIAEGELEVPCRAVSDRCFLSELGLIEFETLPTEDQDVLVWGKATRYVRKLS